MIALILLLAATSVDWSHAQQVNVTMVDDKFVPDHLTFQRGVTYRLHLEDHGKEQHEFTAPEFLAASIVRDPGALANGGKEAVLQPGATAEIYLEPTKPGKFPLTCADHDWDGMVGEIEVH